MKSTSLASAVAALVALLLFVTADYCIADQDLFLSGPGWDASSYGILYEGNGGNSLQLNNSNLTGDIGIGGTGLFQGNGPGTITGEVDFSAANTGQFSKSGLTITGGVPSGTPNYGVSSVDYDLLQENTLSKTLGLETGTSTTISTGGSVIASSGMSDGNGHYVFTVTNISFANGTFTVNGGPNDYVVFNIAGSVGNNGLNGSIVLKGGITADHVLFNYTPDTSSLTTYNSDYAGLSGGPTMTISTNGLTTTGIFLDPTGCIQINHCTLDDGWIIGGDTHNLSFVSGANLTVPAVPPVPPAVPEPSILVSFLGIGALGLLGYARRRKGIPHTSVQLLEIGHSSGRFCNSPPKPPLPSCAFARRTAST